jgi:hypothetical protein
VNGTATDEFVEYRGVRGEEVVCGAGVGVGEGMWGGTGLGTEGTESGVAAIIDGKVFGGLRQ